MRIDWRGFASTKGRPVFSRVLGVNLIPRSSINHDTGFLIGWDRWSDGRFDLTTVLFRG